MGQSRHLASRQNKTGGGVTVGPDGCAAILRDLIMLEKWGDRSFVTFHKGRCKVCQLGKTALRVMVQAGGQLAGKEVGEKGPVGSRWT